MVEMTSESKNIMPPDEMSLVQDLNDSNFRLGVEMKKWDLVCRCGIIAMISIQACDGTDYYLRLDCQNYPNDPPTGGFWDIITDTVLVADQWPKSKGEKGRVCGALRPDWKSGKALYIPCDRKSISRHPEWKDKYPSEIWKPTEGITHYLEIVHELLNCHDYQTPNCTTA